MTGGHATAGGVGFHCRAAAWFAVHALARLPVGALGISATPAAVELEAGAAVDDFVVRTEEDGILFVNAKTNVAPTIGKKSVSQLESVIEQFVRQYWTGRNGPALGRRPLDTDRDRLILVVDRRKSARLLDAAGDMFERFQGLGSIDAVRKVATEANSRLLDNLVLLVRQCWSKLAGVEPDEADIVNVLSLVRVLGLDLDGADGTSAVGWLRHHVVEDGDTQSVWVELCKLMLDFATQRSGADRSRLRAQLRGRNVRFRNDPAYGKDIRNLRNLSQDALGRLNRFAQLPALAETGALRIQRSCTDELVQMAPLVSLLVTGEPGAGKSGAMFEAAERLLAAGHPVLLLAVEDYPVPTLQGLYSALGIAHDLAAVLQGWESEKPGILMIDALDASRGNESERVFRNLIDGVVGAVPNWRVVATIRTFDLRHGQELTTLFKGEPCSETFRAKEFSRVRHLHIPLLSPQELDQARTPTFSPLARLLAIAEADLRDLVRSPFNLARLADILANGIEPESLTGISTAVQLLDRYWEVRVAGKSGRRLSREAFLRVALKHMLETRQLSVGMEVFATDQAERAEALLKDGVLAARTGRTATDIRSISFAHHRLFDYAVARLHLKSGEDKELLEVALVDDGGLLLRTPALMLVFQMLWDGSDAESTDHSIFWNTALWVAGRDDGFEATLAPKIVAEARVRQGDLAPLLTRLALGHGERDCALRFIKHCFAIQLAGVVPDDRCVGPVAGDWCDVALAVSKAAGLDAAWPIHVLAMEWSGMQGLTPLQKASLNAVARHFLALLSANGSYPGRAGVVDTAIRILSRTYDAAPTMSAAALRTLLTSDHIAMHGHEDLHRLAHAAKALLAPAPELVGDIFRATFQTPLPSAEDKTEIGRSRILPLRSDRRQDFEMAIHILKELVAPFVRSAPAVALDAIVAVLDTVIPRDYGPGEEETFDLHGQIVRFRQDGSHYWWQPDDEIGRHALLDGVVEGLVALAQEKGASAFSPPWPSSRRRTPGPACGRRCCVPAPV